MKVWLISGVSFFITIQASEARIKALKMQQPGGTQPQPVDGFEIDIQGNDPGGKMNSTGPYALLITQKTMRSLPGAASKTQESDQEKTEQVTFTTLEQERSQGSIATLVDGVKFLWGVLWSLEN